MIDFENMWNRALGSDKMNPDIQQALSDIKAQLGDIQSRLTFQDTKMRDALARMSALARSTVTEQRSHITPVHLLRPVKLGRRAVKHDRRTLQFKDYAQGLLAPNALTDWTSGITSWGMMLNDQLADCTIAGCGHAEQTWSAALGNEYTLPDWVIQFYYQTWDGYVPGNPSTDQGGFEVDVLNNWRKYGFGLRTAQGLATHKGANKIYAYVNIDPTNHTHVMQAIQLFGGVYMGVGLPLTARSQVVWDVVGDGRSGQSAPGSWGGHCMWQPYYSGSVVRGVTWGGLQDMTWRFWDTYVDECYALLSYDWINATGVSASGFDLPTLEADLQLVVN